MPGIFRRHCSQSCVYSDETTWRPRWLKTPEMAFRDSKFQNVPGCFGPQELVPLVRVPKPPTIHYQPAGSILLYGIKFASVFREKYLEIVKVEIATRQMMIGKLPKSYYTRQLKMRTNDKLHKPPSL